MREAARVRGCLRALMAAAAAVRSPRHEGEPPRNWARVERGECIGAAVERLISFAGRLEPGAHGMAAHEASADLLAGKLVQNSR
jgi:hypothetical protein